MTDDMRGPRGAGVSPLDTLISMFARNEGDEATIRELVQAHLAESVWARLEAMPGFTAGLRQAERDLAEGKGTRFVRRRSMADVARAQMDALAEEVAAADPEAETLP